MAVDLGYRINDADNHFIEPPDCFERYIDPKYADLAIRNVTAPDGTLVKPDVRKMMRDNLEDYLAPALV